MKYILVYFDDRIENIECFQSLLNEQFEVIGCQNLSQYGAILKAHLPHAILLDLHMPVMSGTALFEKIQESDDYNGCPVFFISGDFSDESRVKTYEAGGVDFFKRDLRPEEISLRLINKIKVFQQGRSTLVLGNLELNALNYSASLKQVSVDLTLVEMRLLGILLRAYPRPVNKQDIIHQVWGTGNEGKILVHLSNLRSKLFKWNHEIRARGETIFIQEL